MRGFQTKLDVIGNNIANVNTIGFKGSRVMFQDMLSQKMSGVTAPTDETGGVNSRMVGLGSTISAIDVIHTPGSAMTTNVVTDLRIEGDGFFAIAPSDDYETPYLTRAGNFTLDAERRLVTADGMFVLAEGGDIIQLDEEVNAFSIGKNGEIIAANADGTSESTGIFIGLVMVTNPRGLEQIGGNLYQMTPNSDVDIPEIGFANDPEIGSGAIISGELEMSNVDLTAEFAEMIVSQRGFQANSRIITTSDEILQEVVNLKR